MGGGGWDGEDFHPILAILLVLTPRQQNPQHLRRCLHCAFPKSLLVEAAERMRQHHERVIRYSADIRHRLAARNERLRADYRGGNAALFESYTVMHTA